MKVLSVNAVSKIFPNGLKALDEVSFSAEEGECIVAAGSNGSGKTVLMNIIAQLEESSSGSVTVQQGKSIGLIFQDADAQILGETVEEDASFGPRNAGYSKNEIKEKVNSSLTSTGLAHKKDSPSRLLSGGEKRRLAVAGVLAMDCDILIFDEPFANLDWPGVKQVCSIIAQLKKEGKTLIVLTHELEKILSLADRFLVLHYGKLCFDGDPEEGLKLDLNKWGIRNPLVSYESIGDLLW